VCVCFGAGQRFFSVESFRGAMEAHRGLHGQAGALALYRGDEADGKNTKKQKEIVCVCVSELVKVFL